MQTTLYSTHWSTYTCNRFGPEVKTLKGIISLSLSKALGFPETPFLSQWMLLAFTGTSHRRMALLQYARHTRNSMTKTLLYSSELCKRNAQPHSLGEFFPTKSQFSGKDYLQIHGTAMGPKATVAFANIFMAKIEQTLLGQNTNKPLAWKRFIFDIFCLWDHKQRRYRPFIEKANVNHPTIKFTAEVLQIETTFLDTEVCKGERLENERFLDVRTHFKPTENLWVPSLQKQSPSRR